MGAIEVPRVRSASVLDVPSLSALSREAGSSWSSAMILAELSCSWSRTWVIESDDELVAFCIAWVVTQELQILNVGTAQHRRRQGLARLVITQSFEYARTQGCQWAHLEVRKGNQAAIALYRSLNFADAGRRANYYSDNGETALLMRREL